MIRINAKDYGKEGAQTDEKDMSAVHHFRYATKDNAEYLQAPIKSWDELRDKVVTWSKETGFKSPDVVFGYVKEDEE